MKFEAFENFSTLSAPSGFEYELRDYIIREVKPFADSLNIDKVGNIIAFKKGKSTNAKSIVLCTAIDEVGLLISDITKDGCLKFEILGELSAQEISCKRVEIGAKKIKGIIGTKPIHVLNSEEREKPLKLNSLYIDIGADNKEQAEAIVEYGDVVSFLSDFQQSKEKLYGKALNTKIPCFLLLELIKQKNNNDIYFVFTTQSKLGARGAKIASFEVKVDEIIVLGTSEANSKAEGNNCSLGDGVIIPINTGNLFFNKNDIKRLSELAKEKDIKYCVKSIPKKNKDAESFALSKEGVKTLCVLLPCRYTDGVSMVACKTDCVELEKLLIEIITA